MTKNTPSCNRAYYDNGHVFQEVPYIGGKITGTFREYHKNGALSFENPMVDGMRHGTCKQWNEEGQLLGSYKMKMGTGFSKRWHPNGKLKFEAHLIKEIFNGRTRLWLESGKLKQETFQIANRRVTKKQYDKACANNPTLPKYKDD